MKLWQLKKISDGSALNEPQLLPENWGPIFGLQGVEDRLGDLSWLGDDYKDMGWFVVGDAPQGPPKATKAEIEWGKAKQLLKDSDWAVLSDIPMANGKRSEWIEYRKSLREIRLQAGFPDNIQWPVEPT